MLAVASSSWQQGVGKGKGTTSHLLPPPLVHDSAPRGNAVEEEVGADQGTKPITCWLFCLVWSGLVREIAAYSGTHSTNLRCPVVLWLSLHFLGNLLIRIIVGWNMFIYIYIYKCVHISVCKRQVELHGFVTAGGWLAFTFDSSSSR